MTTPFHHPDAQYGNKATLTLAGTGGKTFTDQYFFRLAEAFLLRAEAYINTGKKSEAAADINVLRNRVQAKNVTSEDMTIDFILDERLRELVCEEKRRLTLARVGKLSERIKKYTAQPTAQMVKTTMHTLICSPSPCRPFSPTKMAIWNRILAIKFIIG